MAIGSVSFGNSTVFADLVNKPQTYTGKPNASTGIAGEKKSHKGAAIGVGVAVAVIATAAGLIYGAKNGKFDFEKLKKIEWIKNAYDNAKIPGKEKAKNFTKSAIKVLNTAGNKLADWGTKALDWAKNLLPKAEKAAETAAETAQEVVANA